jgi:hypothetical protein
MRKKTGRKRTGLGLPTEEHNTLASEAIASARKELEKARQREARGDCEGALRALALGSFFAGKAEAHAKSTYAYSRAVTAVVADVQTLSWKLPASCSRTR